MTKAILEAYDDLHYYNLATPILSKQVLPLLLYSSQWPLDATEVGTDVIPVVNVDNLWSKGTQRGFQKLGRRRDGPVHTVFTSKIALLTHVEHIKKSNETPDSKQITCIDCHTDTEWGHKNQDWLI